MTRHCSLTAFTARARSATFAHTGPGAQQVHTAPKFPLLIRRIVCTALALVSSLVFAQTAEIIPVEKEPRHRTIYEDARTRILEIRVPAGDESLMHNHSHDGVHITVQGARISETTPRGWWASTHAASAPGLTYYSALNGRPYAHRIKNIDTVGTHIIAVELLGAAPVVARPVAALGYAERIANNDRVEIGRLKVAAGGKLAMPAFSERLLLVSLSSGRARVGDAAMALKPGSVHWLEASPAQDLMAPDGSDLELIAVQFK